MAFLKTIGKAVISGVAKPEYTVINSEEVGELYLSCDMRKEVFGINANSKDPEQPAGIEERHYPPAQWVSTQVKHISHNDARDIAFKRLFKYITGENEGGKKVDMTAPVATKIIPGEGPNCENTFIVSFFISPDYQSDPPKPTNPDVFIEEFPDMTVYTKSFGGFAKDNNFIEEAKLLTDKTKTKSIHEDFYYTAGYDSPMKLINRTNEVWFVKKD